MKRGARLQSAKQWLAVYSGNNVLKSYKNWFGVDWQCAIVELKTLGAKLDQKYIEQVLKSTEQRTISRQQQKIAKQKKQQEVNDILHHFDDEYYIAGYTSWGFLYGGKWAELTKEEQDYLRDGF